MVVNVSDVVNLVVNNIISADEARTILKRSPEFGSQFGSLQTSESTDDEGGK